MSTRPARVGLFCYNFKQQSIQTRTGRVDKNVKFKKTPGARWRHVRSALNARFFTLGVRLLHVDIRRCKSLRAQGAFAAPHPPPQKKKKKKKKKKSNMLKNFLELRCVPGVCLYVSNKFHARNMQIKHDLKQTCYFQTRCTVTGKMEVCRTRTFNISQIYTHVHHINFEKCMPVSISFWVSCMLQFNTFLSLSCEEFVRIHHICEELFLIYKNGTKIHVCIFDM